MTTVNLSSLGSIIGAALPAASVPTSKLAASGTQQVAFTATNASYTVRTGYQVAGAWMRPGAGGGGGGGAAGTSNGTASGGSGSGGKAGGSCTLFFVPITAASGHVLNISIGAGGAGGAGGVQGGSAAQPGGNGNDTTITDTTASTVLANAYAMPGSNGGGGDAGGAGGNAGAGARPRGTAAAH